MAEVALREYVTDIDGMIEKSAYDAAINHCRHILTQYPKYLEAYRVLGKALLEKDDQPAAGDVFQRVLSVDPEDFVARVGLSIVRDRQGELEPAIWHMERAYDLMPGNEIIQSELRRLYTRRDGVEPERVSLTRSALARMYAHGDLYVEAIANLRQLLHEQPDRLDLQVLLAEVLWRNEQRIEASELALAITAKSPYCLKANLILGDMLQAGGHGEGEIPLRRAQAIDPDNSQAARLFGSDSALPARSTVITRLEPVSYSQLLETEGPAANTEAVPDWLRGLAELNTPAAQIEPPGSALNPLSPTGLQIPGTQPSHGEIPHWLQGLAAPQEEAVKPRQELPDWLAAMGTASLTSKPAKPAATPPTEDWSAPLQVAPTPEPASAMRDEDVPDWIRQLGTGALDPSKLPAAKPAANEKADWMSKMSITGLLDQTVLTAPAEPATPDETPDWLRQLGNTGPLDRSAASTGGDTPDWLAQIQGTVPPSTAAEAGSADTSDWLAQLQATAPPLDQTAGEETPDWLAQLGGTGPLGSSEPPIESPTPPAARKIAVDADRVTIERLVEAFSPAAPAEPLKPAQAEGDISPDAALAFFARLSAGKEDQLRAEAEAEGESRLAAIMGRRAEPAKPIEPEPVAEIEAAPVEEVPEWLSHLGSTPVTEPAVSTPVDELPEWLRGLRPTEDAVTIELAAEPVAEVTLLSEGDISPDAALAFFARLSAGKEDQLRAEAEAEGESRLAAIMGRQVEPAKPIEPEPEVATPEAAATLKGDISPDAALAFFVRLSAGKEDQLRAEAEAEGESRMAAIMGRPVEPAKPIVAVVAEAATPEPVAPEAAATLEGDISPDAALAFFARLSAGKEDQLRAEAEAEGESRLAAIMGRPVEPAKPIVAVVAEVATPEPVAPEAATALEGDISPDAALAFFARLSAGKEDQLRAEAEAEGESRLAAIMGRPVEPAKPIELEPVAEIEAVSVDELPAWLQAMQPGALETPAAGDAATDALTLEAVTIEPTLMEVTVSDTFDVEPTSTQSLPEWLRNMQPSAPDAEPTPSDALPDWLRAIQPESSEVVDERAVAEVEPEPVSDAVIEAVSMSEVAAIAAPTPAPIDEGVSAAPVGPVSWWTQSAADEGEQPISELPAAVKPATSTARLAPAAPGAPAPRMSRGRTPEPAGREMRRRYTRSTEKRRVEVEPAPALNLVNIDPLVTQLESDKYNHAVRLELARAWWSMGNRDSALDEYGKLINPARVENLGDEELDERDFAEAGPLTDDIIADLERIVEIDERAAWPRLLGDVYMQTGDLSRALEMYRRALSQL